ncbi:ABC transporter permease [Urbifossiella limnaea]|uniref:ABC-2 family transporter protein n=1 Tax=Urbifossiella limnaea TaxID=2528023 RepID=A0A517XNH3_9BACT|nr:ABC transporter permease [Urbifossiella limnaea]QDU19064.1 ABC-2 family transporter protein [Urbifossiella limnaea]
MQFLAFLKDSYREARNGWMLQIMLVLATLLIVLVASIGYRPITLQDRLDAEFKIMRWAMSHNPQAFEELGRPEFGVENFTSTNAPQPWRADYTFDYVVKVNKEGADLRKLQRQGIPLGRERIRSQFRDDLAGQYETVEVTGGPPELEPKEKEKGKGPDEEAEGKADKKKDDGPPPPPEARYHVVVRGSKVDDELAWPHQVTVLFAFDPPGITPSLRDGVYLTEDYLVNGIGAWVLLLVSVVITAGFIPTMLAKGSLDLIVSKPIGRTRLLVYKYLGGLMFIFLLTAYTVLGVWLVIGLRSGLWSPNFLMVIPLLTFFFAVLYAVSTLAAVLTRSTIVAILVTAVAWGLMWGVGKLNTAVEDRQAALKEAEAAPLNPRAGPPDPDGRVWFVFGPGSWPFVKAVHYVTPRTYQLDERLGRVIAEGVLTPNQLKAQKLDKPPRASWAEILGVSVGFIAVVLGLGCWRFAGRDY